MIEELEKNGILHLTQQTESQLADLLQQLGTVIMTTDVIVKPEGRGMVTTALGLDFHTDHHKAKYIVWYCHKQTDKGGESILLDAKAVYESLPIDQQKELTTIELFEHKVFDDDLESYPFVKVDENGAKKFYYSFWLVKEDDKYKSAMLAFQKGLRTTQHQQLRLEDNDVLIIDNHRIFHGRRPIEGSKDRFLKRYWLTQK